MVDHAVPITEIYQTGVQPDKALIRQYEVEQDDAIDNEVARAEAAEGALESDISSFEGQIAVIDTSLAAIEQTLAIFLGQGPTFPKYAPNGPARLATAGAMPAYTYDNGSSGVGATLTGNSTGTLTIDGSLVALNDRILVKNETSGNAPNNGLYLCTTAGASGVNYVLTRATDADTPSELNNLSVFVSAGSTNSNKTFTNVDPVTTVGTSNILFNQTSGGQEFRTSFFQTFATPLTAADTACAASGGTLVIDTNETLSGSVTFSSIAVRFAGGKVTLGSNNLTIPYAGYERFSDPRAQIFVQTGSGIVIFSKASRLSWLWWGGTANGASPALADEMANTAAMLAAHKSVFTNAPGSEIIWPDGNYAFAAGTNQTNSGTKLNVLIGFGPISHRGASAMGVRWYIDPTTITPTSDGSFIGFFGGGNPLTGGGSGLKNSAFIGNSVTTTRAANNCVFFGAQDPAKVVNGLVWENIHYVYDPTAYSGAFLGTNIFLIPLYFYAVYNSRMENCWFIGAPNDGANWCGSGSWDDCHFALCGFYSGSADGDNTRNGATFVGWQDALNPDALTSPKITITRCTFNGNADTGLAYGGCCQNQIIENCSANGNRQSYEGVLSGGERLTQWQATTLVNQWDNYYTPAGLIFQYTSSTGGQVTGSSAPTGSVGDTGVTDGTATAQIIGTMPADGRVAACYAGFNDRSTGKVAAFLELPFLGKAAMMDRTHFGGATNPSQYYLVCNSGNEKRFVWDSFEARDFGYASATSSIIGVPSNNGGDVTIRGTLDGCYMSSSANGMVGLFLDGQESWGGYHQGYGANNKGRAKIDVRIKNPSVQSTAVSWIYVRGAPVSYDINIVADYPINGVFPKRGVVVEHAYRAASILEYGKITGYAYGNTLGFFDAKWTNPSGSTILHGLQVGPGKFYDNASSGTITSPLTSGLVTTDLSASSALTGLISVRDCECSWAGAVSYPIGDSGNLTGGVSLEAIGNSFCEAPEATNWWLLANGLVTGTAALIILGNDNPSTPGHRILRGTATPTTRTWQVGDAQKRSNAAASGVWLEQATTPGTLDTTPMSGFACTFPGSSNKTGSYTGTPPVPGQWITIVGDGTSRQVAFAAGGVIVMITAPGAVTGASAAYSAPVFKSLSLSS